MKQWKHGVIAVSNTSGPTTLVFSRQNLPVLDRSVCSAAAGLRRGGYILWESAPNPELILIATGSEVSLTLTAARKLAENGTKVRVVSLPSWEIFDRQPQEYRDSVLPPADHCPHLRGSGNQGLAGNITPDCKEKSSAWKHLALQRSGTGSL
jgi:transketolase